MKPSTFGKPCLSSRGGERPPSLEQGLGLFDKGYRIVVRDKYEVDTDDTYTTEANA
jgi:hypothetical protein